MIRSAAVQQAANLNPLKQLGQVRYLFSPVAISLEGRESVAYPAVITNNYGQPVTDPATGQVRRELRRLEVFPAWEIVQITDQDSSYRASTDEEILRNQFTSPYKMRVRPSFEIVDDLLYAFGDRGMTWLQELDNEDVSAVALLDERLAQSVPRDSLQAARAYLSEARIPEAFEPIRQKMLTGLEQYAEWSRLRLNTIASEVSASRKPNSQSIRTFFVESEHRLAAWLGFKLTDPDIGVEEIGASASGGNGFDVNALGAAIGGAMAQHGTMDDARIARIVALTLREMEREEGSEEMPDTEPAGAGSVRRRPTAKVEPKPTDDARKAAEKADLPV